MLHNLEIHLTHVSIEPVCQPSDHYEISGSLHVTAYEPQDASSLQKFHKSVGYRLGLVLDGRVDAPLHQFQRPVFGPSGFDPLQSSDRFEFRRCANLIPECPPHSVRLEPVIRRHTLLLPKDWVAAGQATTQTSKLQLFASLVCLRSGRALANSNLSQPARFSPDVSTAHNKSPTALSGLFRRVSDALTHLSLRPVCNHHSSADL